MLKPTEVTKSSAKKVRWICENGHEREAIIANRTK
ncbi:zinc-ribbon domain-containing protein [bacterium]|nr:zinc-ribbon domain-containing protein [bacterium]